jgi:hypothetical protein
MKKFSNTGRYFPFISALDCFVLYFQVNLYRLSKARNELLTNKFKLQLIKGLGLDTAVAFTFMGNHHYLWDKKHNLVQVQWDNKTVISTTKH